MALSLIQEFNALFDKVQHYRSIRISETEAHANTIVPSIVAALKRFRQLALRTTPIEKQALLDSDIGKLYRVYDVFKFQAELYITDVHVRRQLKQEMLLVLHALDIQNPSNVFNGLPTQFLTQFCKGITYFQGETITERPFYHRDKSCGSRTQTVENKFTIPNRVSKKVQNQTESAIVRCLIERLCYDRLYMHILHEQDAPHLEELMRMQRIMIDTLPSTEILCSFQYVNQIYPIALEIQKKTNVSGNSVVESYTKTSWDSLRVKCEKTVYSNKVAIQYFLKEQSFGKEMPWRVAALPVAPTPESP